VIAQCESELAYLRDVFKRYQEKNKWKVSQKELESRAKNVDLLRRNLNLLQDEFREQINRVKREQQQDLERNGDFINVFGRKRKGSEEEEEESDRDVNEEERDILAQFEENDKELENIAAELVEALDKVKLKAENSENLIKRQGELLKKTRKKAEDNEHKLRQNNNALKSILEKHKNGK